MIIDQILQNSNHTISESRKTQLKELSVTLKDQINKTGRLEISFICTHNSRRSQLAEFLFFIFYSKYNLKNMQSFSGGTEATAFNHRMIAALGHLGYDFIEYGLKENPLYIYRLHGKDHYFYSKRYDDPFNPKNDYIAVTVCSDADRNCPFIPDVKRFHLQYEDPKIADDTPEEMNAYKNKVYEVATELNYMFLEMLKANHD